MNPSEKATEEFYLNLLRKFLPSFPSGKVIPSESPDFVIDVNSIKIGIEVTRLFKSANSHGEQLQIQENERNLLVAESLSIYKKTGLPCVEVKIHFSAHTSFNKKNRKEYANRIALLIASNVPTDQSWISLNNSFDHPNVFPYEIDSISIARNGHTENFWSVPDAGWIQEDFVTELQSLINKKNQLVINFNKDCKYHWLVVVIEGMSGSTLFEPSEKTLSHIYECKFDKLFLLDRFNAKGYELQNKSVI